MNALMEFENLHNFLRPHSLGRDLDSIGYTFPISHQTHWPQVDERPKIFRQDNFMIDRVSREELNSLWPPDQSASITSTVSRSPLGQESQTSSSTPRRSKRLAGQEPSPDQDVVTESSRKRQARGRLQREDTQATQPTAQATAQTASRPIETCGRITVAFVSQPPAQVRTGSIMPRLRVRVTIEGSAQLAHLGPSMGLGTLHAVVSLWSADGQVASPHAVPPLLTGHKDATLVSISPPTIFERRVEASFADLAISESGHYRLRVSVMETPLPEDDEDRLGSPRQLMSIETRPIHAHGFASVI